jgi:hypothetical protein
MTGLIEPEYQAEVDRSTARLEKQYRERQRAVASAERRAAKLAATTTTPGKRTKAAERDLRAAWELVEQRRAELNRLAGLMQASPAGSQNRGRESYRPVPIRHGGNI